MLTAYRTVLGLPGALVFSLSGLVARLPISMISLGIVLLVSTRTGSYSLAGTVSAAFLVTNAAFAVPQARLVDRLGQHRVLPPATALFVLALVALMAVTEGDVAAPWPHVCAALAGVGMPQIGSCVRARWSHLLAGRGERSSLQTAFAFEAVVDETVFIVGPVLVTVLATVVHPLAGLTAAGLAAAVGTAVLVSQRRTEPPAGAGREHGHGGPMPWAVLGPLVVCAALLGVALGGAEVATVAFADERGHKPLAGLLLAVWALGSLLAGAVTGVVRLRASNPARFRWSLLVLGLSLVPMPLVDGFVVLGALLFVSGFAISPTLIASMAWIEEIVPPGRITEGISLFTTGLATGLAPGAALVGAVVDERGASQSFWVLAVAGLLAAALAFAVARVSVARPSPTGSSG